MSNLNPAKLQIKLIDIKKDVFNLPRKYTLTHSDTTGDLFLTISREYDEKQISGWYTKFMRDEVLGEWKAKDGKHELHLYLHISGGFIFGWAKIRDKIIRSHLKLVFQCIRYAEQEIIERNPDLDKSPIFAHFLSKRKKFNTIELFGDLSNYRI